MPKLIRIAGNQALAIDGELFTGTITDCDIRVGSSLAHVSDVSIVDGEVELTDPIITAASDGDASVVHFFDSITGYAGTVGAAEVVEVITVSAAIAANDTSYNEGEAAQFTITLDQAAPVAIEFSFVITGSVNAQDYAVASSSMTIAEGESSGVISVNLTEDVLTEGTETLTATIENSSGAIITNDNASVSVNDTSLTGAVLTAPVITATEQGDDSVIIAWATVTGADSITLYYGLDGEAQTVVNLAGNATSHQTPILSAGDYVFVVAALNENNDSFLSNEEEITIDEAAAVIDHLVFAIDPTDSNSITTSGSDVTALTDISDDARTIGAISNYTTTTINGVAAIASTAASSGLRVDSLAPLVFGAETLVLGIVVQHGQTLDIANQNYIRAAIDGAYNSWETMQSFYGRAGNTTNSYIAYRANDGLVLSSNNDTSIGFAPAPHTDAFVLQISMSRTGFEVFSNGTSFGAVVYPDVKTSPSPLMNELLIGADDTNGNVSSFGRIEVLNGAIDAQDISDQYTRLATAYGLI